MELVTVSAVYLGARDKIASILAARIPAAITDLIQNMAKTISTPLSMPE